MEQTFVLLKPEVLQRGLVGKILQRFEDKGLKLDQLKMLQLNRYSDKLEEQYGHLDSWKYYKEYLDHLCNGPSIALVLEGHEAVNVVRRMIGSTDPSKSSPGTIRFDFGLTDQRNLIHASANTQEALDEIERWFGWHDLLTVNWIRDIGPWIDRMWQEELDGNAT